MPPEEKRPFDDMAKELLSFLGISEENDPVHAYKLRRTRTFLEMKFGHVQGLQNKVEMLQKEMEALRKLHPPRTMSYLEEERLYDQF
jgi:hypothetical protein